MKPALRPVTLTLSTLLALSLGACAPEVGSEEWCAKLKAKPKGDSTINEAAD